MRSKWLLIAIVLLLSICVITSDKVFAAACDGTPSGLLSWWSLDDNANDSMGANNGTASNVSYASAVSNTGAMFGTNGNIEIAPGNLSPAQFTLTAWVRPDGPGPNPDEWGSVIIQRYPGVSVWWSPLAQKFRFVVWYVDGGAYDVFSNSIYPAGSTYHVAATFDEWHARLYVNGKLAGSATIPTRIVNYGPSSPWTIGSTSAVYRNMGYPRTFNGVIDEVGVYGRALSSCEIHSVMAMSQNHNIPSLLCD